MTSIADSELSASSAYAKEHELVQSQGWSFYGFNVSEQDYQVVVNVAAEADSPCETFLTSPVLYYH